MDEAQIWEQTGEEGIRRMVACFYRRIRSDDLIGPMYPPDDFDGAEARLADFLCFRFGAQMGYVLKRGHPRLRMRHAPFSIGVEERDRWLSLMEESMKEAGIPEEAAGAMQVFFAQVGDFLRNRE